MNIKLFSFVFSFPCIYLPFLLKTCQVFTPLVEKCKKYGRAMRIGTNHGSLSDRIMSYYGDSPRGMVNKQFLSSCEMAFAFVFFSLQTDRHHTNW